MSASRDLDRFESVLFSGAAVRIGERELWRALAEVFPHRSAGPAERTLLLDTLRALAGRGSIQLPPEHGRRWDRSLEPAVPTSVAVIRDPVASADSSWRTFPWHQRLAWVPGCRALTVDQVRFLRRVHEGLVAGTFAEPAPLKYRSLQLTGDEKLLASLAKSALFGPSRLSLALLGCLPEGLPLAWEPVGPGGRLVIFENAGPFAVARLVLGKLRERPYDLVAYGGGRGVLAAIRHVTTLERPVESICYVGDLDHAGLDIGLAVRHRAVAHGLPPVIAATELHRQMLAAAASLGFPEGWPAPGAVRERDPQRVLEAVAPELRSRVRGVLQAGRRIPEEVLGPKELRVAWSGG